MLYIGLHQKWLLCNYAQHLYMASSRQESNWVAEEFSWTMNDMHVSRRTQPHIHVGWALRQLVPWDSQVFTVQC